VKLAGAIGLVRVPVLDHELGHLAVDEELERLVTHLLAHDGVDAQRREGIAASSLATIPRHHRDTTATAFRGSYGRDDIDVSWASATLRAVEDYTHKYKGEQVEVELFGGEYQDGTLTAYCGIEGVPHLELNGHILIPLQNIASLHCSSRCDAPEPDWPPRGLTGADGDEP
jgi:hypothetical protein